MIPDHAILYKNFISDEERITLKEYTLDLLKRGFLQKNSAGKHRYYKSFYDSGSLDYSHKQLFDRVLSTLCLENNTIDPMLGLIISCITPGGFIHRHKDKYGNNSSTQHLINKRNYRFNVMIERSESVCYDPHIEDEPLKVNKCDAWSFNASKLYHSTPIIKGPEFRIVYQFGFCLDNLE